MKPYIIGYRQVPVWHIPVKIAPNDEDWQFVFVRGSDGKLHLSVF